MRTINTILCFILSINLYGQRFPFADSTKYFTIYSKTGKLGSHFLTCRYEDANAWNRFKKHCEDSSTCIIPIIEDIPKSEARKIRKRIESIDDTIGTVIVPWSAVTERLSSWYTYTVFNTYEPKRMIDRCDSCGTRLIISKINLPYELKAEIMTGKHKYQHMYLKYCSDCGVQYEIIRGSSLRQTTTISHVPKSLVGFWECKHGYNLFNTRHPYRTIMEISEEGIMKMWHEELLWNDYDFVPKCMWINSTLSQCLLRYIMFDQDVIYTFIGNNMESYSIERGARRLVLKHNVSIAGGNPSVKLSRANKYDRVDRFKKIDSPYSVFPNIGIGQFPNHYSFKDPIFWNKISDAVVLTELDDSKTNILDSLGVRVHKITLLTDESSINLDELFRALDVIHNCESNGTQTLILCDSKGHYLSKLVGECYHYQKSNKLLDPSFRKLLGGSYATNSILKQQCESTALPTLEEMKEKLKRHAKCTR